MATLLDSRGIRLFHYAKQFAEPLREAIRRHVEQVAAREGIEVEYIKSRRALAKKDRIAEILAQRDTHPVANCFAATVPLFVKCSHAVKSTFTPARSGVRFRKSFEYLRTISRAADSR